MTEKDRIKYLDISLRISGIQASKQALLLITRLAESILRKKGELTLDNILEIKEEVEKDIKNDNHVET